MWIGRLRWNMCAIHSNRIGKEDGQEQIGMWANPMNTVEELYLAKKLAEGLGIKHVATRLQQQDKRLSDGLKGAQWLGQSI